MRYLCIVAAILGFVITPAMAQPDIGVVCFSDDFESYPVNQRLRSLPPWGYGSGPENKIELDAQGDKAVRLKGTAGRAYVWSTALTMPNYANCMGGKVQIIQCTMQSDVNRQNSVGNHLYVGCNESSGGTLAYWYGWSSNIAPRWNGGAGPGVDITDGAEHVFTIVYDPATGVCDWLVDGALQYSATMNTGYAVERFWVEDLSRSGGNSVPDVVWFDDVIMGTPPIELALDILPSDDPNLFTVNMLSKGRLPMQILGTEEAAASEIDVNSISIGGVVFPVKTPKLSDDGGDYVVVHVSRRELIAALGLDTMEPGTVVDVTVEGALLDGTLFTATDSIVLVARED